MPRWCPKLNPHITTFFGAWLVATDVFLFELNLKDELFYFSSSFFGLMEKFCVTFSTLLCRSICLNSIQRWFSLATMA